MDKSELTKNIKNKAISIGFDFCGIAKADYLPLEASLLRKWLDHGSHASLSYMENNFDKRVNPINLFENAKSVICLASSYYFPYEKDEESFKIARYALGEDYHKVLKAKLNELAKFIVSIVPETKIKKCVDSAPIMEKPWAVKAGLGFIGKNNLFIIPNKGSYYFLSELIIDTELAYDKPYEENHCKNCMKCLIACPSGALESPYLLNVSKCLSYLNKDSDQGVPDKYKGKTQKFIYGCDICQDVCPINKKPKETKIKEFYPSQELLELMQKNFSNFDEDAFNKTFNKSSISRLGYEKLIRNILFCKDKE